jgi:hypothetical protein
MTKSDGLHRWKEIKIQIGTDINTSRFSQSRCKNLEEKKDKKMVKGNQKK